MNSIFRFINAFFRFWLLAAAQKIAIAERDCFARLERPCPVVMAYGYVTRA